uniref:Uncharacterized protein n=1 Tax=Ananas comosus var. bracteatus TaxID=296719 RepID=A0A6V7NY89_ANACO|nr:unnamed protein product [Ananas comosus var. bracteatus]
MKKLFEVLWACRTSVKTATGMTPFQLVYGHEAVIPAEITVPSLRIEKQKDLSADEYSNLMKDKAKEVCDTRLIALDNMQAYQSRLRSAYNKRVRSKTFVVSNLVLRLVFQSVKKTERMKNGLQIGTGHFMSVESQEEMHIICRTEIGQKMKNQLMKNI